MSNEKTKATKGDLMEDAQDLHALVTDLLGEKDIKAFFDKAAARANAKVTKDKKERNAKEQEEFEHACLRKEVWELFRVYSLDATQPRIMSWRWLRDAGAKGVVNAIVFTGAIAAAGAITRATSTTTETTTEGEGTTNTLWSATPRASRRTSKMDVAI